MNVYKGTRVECIREHMGCTVGDKGTVLQADDYVPGWDAGMFSVQPDDFPGKSHYGHNAVSYWTAEELLNSWKVIAW